VKAFGEFVVDVESGRYPEDQHLVHAGAGVFDQFVDFLESTE
jgi:isochorismate synthase EntC